MPTKMTMLSVTEEAMALSVFPLSSSPRLVSGSTSDDGKTVTCWWTILGGDGLVSVPCGGTLSLFVSSVHGGGVAR